MQIDSGEEGESMSSDETSEEEDSDDELDFYTSKTDSEKFLDDPNSSAYI